MLPEVDLVIGAVLVHGAKAPHVITREQLGLMKQHAVLVDVSIDQGGCFETSRPTTHTDPTYEVDGVTHYCVANMPGAVPITSTFALTNATMPYVVKLADEGVHAALARDPGFLAGLNVAGGQGHLRARRARPGPDGGRSAGGAGAGARGGLAAGAVRRRLAADEREAAEVVAQGGDLVADVAQRRRHVLDGALDRGEVVVDGRDVLARR